MGAWGYGLFQSDNEFDVVVSDIDEEARKLAKDAIITLFHPKNKKRVVKKLNDGLFHELLQLFIRKEWNHGVIYLAVLSMQLGAIIPAKDLAYVHKTLLRTPMYDEAKAQVQKGLDSYKGEAWDFECKDIVETANALPPTAEKDSGGANDWEKQMEQVNKGMEEWKARNPKPKSEPESHAELPKEEKDRINEAVKEWFAFQMAP
ncbi:MAG: hypothetical protein Q9207_004841 [Kuettlingeria erythrocarpa]